MLVSWESLAESNLIWGHHYCKWGPSTEMNLYKLDACNELGSGCPHPLRSAAQDSDCWGI